MRKNINIESADEFNPLSAEGDAFHTAEIASNRFVPRHSNGTHDSAQVAPEKHGVGAPKGNQNAFRSGVTLLERATRRTPGRSTTRPRRVAGRVTSALIEGLGGEAQISEQVRVICGITGNQAGRYDRAIRAYENILRRGGERLRKNLVSLGKLDSVLRPLEDSITRNLEKLGLGKVARPRDIFDWQPSEDKAPPE